jgi:hypothetical protein
MKTKHYSTWESGGTQLVSTEANWLRGNRFIVWFRSTLLRVLSRFCTFVLLGLTVLPRHLVKVRLISHVCSHIDSLSRLCLLSRIKTARGICCKNHPRNQDHNRAGQIAKRKGAESDSLQSGPSVAGSREQAKSVKAMIYLFEYDVPFWLLRDTTALESEVKSFPGWAQCFQKTWLIATHDTIDVVEQKLQRHLQQPQDKLLLIPIEQYSQYKGRLPQEIWDWINSSRNQGF